MHERKARMAELADGFVALPGGYGTLDEIAEMLTWNQLGLQAKPVVFLDIDGFWSPMLGMFDAAVDYGFVRPPHRMLAPHRHGRRGDRPGHRARAGDAPQVARPRRHPRIKRLGVQATGR